MCNNRPCNQLRKIKREEVVKDKISDWIEDRPMLALKNERAIKKRRLSRDAIEYAIGYPLKLNDGSRIHRITAEVIDGKYKEVCVELNIREETQKRKVYFKRYINDRLVDVEKFLSNSQSIYQTRNIDLNYD